ncbi:putative reverse transcriptase domain-containing protein, partial [Tanacetum coccineum]
PTRQILDSKGAIPTMTAADAKVAIQEMAEHSQKWHDGMSTRTRSTETSDGLAVIQAQLNNLEREIKKVNEKVYVAQVGCELCKGPQRYAVSDLQDSKLISIPSQTTIPFLSCLYDYHCDEEEGSYGLKDLDAYSIGTTLRNDALLQKEKDPGSFTLPCYINNFCFEKALADLGANHPKGIAENVLVGIGKFFFPIDFIILDMPEDVKVPLILRRPFLSTAHAKIDVFKGKITLRVRDEKIIFKSVKPVSSLIKRVCMISLRERMELNLKARLIGEALILNRSLDPLCEYYIEINDLNEPSELRRNQVDDLEPTIKEGEVVDEPISYEYVDANFFPLFSINVMSKRFYNSIMKDKVEYKKKRGNYNFGPLSLPGYEYVDANFFPLFSINVMSKRFYNSIMKDKVEYKGKNIVGAFMNVPIFVGKFSIVTDFAVVENMDAYRDEGMGDIIVGRPFCKVACIKANRFDGMITICNGNNNVTYQMARSHPRIKHITNAQCNKMRPLLKVSAQDKLKGFPHPYQKLKGFYKGVLNLGPEYIKNGKVEEWLTRGYVRMLEME